MKNTKIEFYITYVSNAIFYKSVFIVVIRGHHYEKNLCMNWISDNIMDIMNEVNADIVFDHVVIKFKPSHYKESSIQVVETLPGKLVFKKNVHSTGRSYKKLKSVVEKIETSTIEVKKDFPSCWIELNGKIHVVGHACHNDFAWEYLTKTEKLTTDKILGMGNYPYVVLENMGWIKVSGWTNPPSFTFPERITPKQRTSVKEYCQENASELPREILD